MEEQKKRLDHAAGSDNVAVFVAEDPEQHKLAGFVAGRRGNNFRDNHKLHLVIGLRRCYTEKGLGSKLIHELESWALAHQIQRLDLSVIVTNHLAIKLYKRHGFEIEGTRRDSVQLNSGYFDEHIMGKLLAI